MDETSRMRIAEAIRRHRDEGWEPVWGDLAGRGGLLVWSVTFSRDSDRIQVAGVVRSTMGDGNDLDSLLSGMLPGGD